MSYQKQVFQSGQVLLASQLNAMDDQIAANAEAIAANAEAIGQKVSQEQLTEAVQLAKEGTVSYQNAQALTEEDCREIIAASAPTSGGKRAFSRKKAK